MTKPRLLVVEDDAAIRELLATQLELYELSFGRSQEEAFKQLRESEFEFVLLDLRLPVRHGDLSHSNQVGLDILDRIRLKRLTKAQSPQLLPVVVMTAHGDNYRVPVSVLVEHGANDYVAKPWEKTDLLGKLDRALRGGGALVPAATPRQALEIRVAFDLSRERLQIETLPFFEGAFFDLLDSLRPQFQEDMRTGRKPSSYRCLRCEEMASTCGITGASLRQRISRFRKQARKLFRDELQRDLERNDIVENIRDWKGYRLNPHTIRLLDLAEMPKNS